MTVLDYAESLEAQEYLKKVEEELAEELLWSNPVWQRVGVICFSSRSRGRRRKPRKYPRMVILLRLKNSPQRWMSWDGADRNTRTLKWDELATEILGKELCMSLSERGIHADDYLRGEIKKMLR